MWQLRLRVERERGPQLKGALWERQWAHWAVTQNTNSHIMPESLKTPTLGDNGKLHRFAWPLLNTHTQWQHPNKTLCYLWNSTHCIPLESLFLWPAADVRLGRDAINLRLHICTFKKEAPTGGCIIKVQKVTSWSKPAINNMEIVLKPFQYFHLNYLQCHAVACPGPHLTKSLNQIRPN